MGGILLLLRFLHRDQVCRLPLLPQAVVGRAVHEFGEEMTMVGIFKDCDFMSQSFAFVWVLVRTLGF